MTPVSHNSDKTSAGGSAGAQAPQAPGAGPVSPRGVITGGKSRGSVDHGGKRGNPRAALVDYLNASFPVDKEQDPAEAFLARFVSAVGDAFGIMQHRGRGLHGYQESYVFERGGVLFAFGGQRHTGFLSIPGNGCAFVPDWHALVKLLRDELGGRLTRLDGAHDDFEGVHAVDDMVQRYCAGEFNAGGRRPRCTQIGNWLVPDGTGRTFYVGLRRNGKLYRVYERGKLLGDSDSVWVRHEVEWHNIDREIPWEAVLEPGKYVAGAYPALSWISEDAERIKTLQRTDEISYKRLTHHCSVAYGPLVNVMREREGSDAAVLRKLARPGVPRRLEVTQRLGTYERSESDE